MPKTAEMPRVRMEGPLARRGRSVATLLMDGREETVPLDRLRMDSALQSRAEAPILSEVVEDYADQYKKKRQLPAVVLFYDGVDYHPGDGNCRIRGRAAAGFKDVNAVVYPGTRDDAILYAAGANTSHGLPRTREDKRRAIEMVCRHPDCCEWSNTQIAEWCDVDDKTVKKVRDELGLGNPSGTITFTSAQGKTVRRKSTTRRVPKQADAAPPASAPQEAVGRTSSAQASGEAAPPPTPAARNGPVAASEPTGGGPVAAPSSQAAAASGDAVESGEAPAVCDSFAQLWFAVQRFDLSELSRIWSQDERLRVQAADIVPRLRDIANTLSDLVQA